METRVDEELHNRRDAGQFKSESGLPDYSVIQGRHVGTVVEAAL